MAQLFSVKAKKARDYKDKDIQFNRLLKKWKRKYDEFGVKDELVKRKEFIKPSLKKRIEKQKAIREYKREEELKKYLNG